MGDPGYELYKIRSGDTLTGIARRYGTTVDVLVRVNHIWNPERIIAGDFLQVPKRSASSSRLPSPPPRSLASPSLSQKTSSAGRTATAQTARNTGVSSADSVALVFEPRQSSVDKSDPELSAATDLNLPDANVQSSWTRDGLVDAYTALYGPSELVKLLVIFSKQGSGRGYELRKASFALDSWDVDHDKRLIFIDEDEVFSSRTNREAARSLKEVVEQEFEGKESFWGATWRVVKGTGITVAGVAEMVTGAVGLIVPEPTVTKVVGATVVVFGASTAVEGVTQIFNLNHGQGYNPLEEAAALLGNSAGGDTGEIVARRVFLVTNLIVSIGGSYKVLKVPGRKFIFKGTYTGANFSKYWKEGFTVGRLQLNYALGLDAENAAGHVWVNITTNSNQWFFRVQGIGEKLVVNGRIIGVNKWHRLRDSTEICKMLVKLMMHGWR